MSYGFLHSVKPRKILRVFNEAFSDYLMPMAPLSEAVFQWKLQRDGVRLDLSPGFFDEKGRLQGFMLHAEGMWEGEKTVYNAGTGLIPSARRRGGGWGMFQFCLPELREQGVQYLLLECIVQNKPALELYKKVGFSRLRELVCFQGKAPDGIAPPLHQQNLRFVRIRGEVPWQLLESWGTYAPSWQNNHAAVRRAGTSFGVYTLLWQETPIAYAILKPDNGYLAQFAVHPGYRRQGIGTYLFHCVQKTTPRLLTLVNLDPRDQALMGFLQRLGLKETIRQYEMGKRL